MKAFKPFLLFFSMVFVLVLSLTLVQSAYAWTIGDGPTGDDCTSIGTWKAKTKTCTLQRNLSESVVINSNNITFICDGHSITSTDYAGVGIYVIGREDVTIKDCIIESFDIGVEISSSNNITLWGNSLSAFGTGTEISLSSNTTYNTFKHNECSDNYEGGSLPSGLCSPQP